MAPKSLNLTLRLRREKDGHLYTSTHVKWEGKRFLVLGSGNTPEDVERDFRDCLEVMLLESSVQPTTIRLKFYQRSWEYYLHRGWSKFLDFALL